MSWHKFTNPAGHEVWLNANNSERVRHATEADGTARALAMVMTASGHEMPVQETPAEVVREFSA